MCCIERGTCRYFDHGRHPGPPNQPLAHSCRLGTGTPFPQKKEIKATPQGDSTRNPRMPSPRGPSLSARHFDRSKTQSNFPRAGNQTTASDRVPAPEPGIGHHTARRPSVQEAVQTATRSEKMREKNLSWCLGDGSSCMVTARIPRSKAGSVICSPPTMTGPVSRRRLVALLTKTTCSRTCGWPRRRRSL